MGRVCAYHYGALQAIARTALAFAFLSLCAPLAWAQETAAPETPPPVTTPTMEDITAPPEEANATAEPNKPSLLVSTSKKGDDTTIIFPFPGRVAAATFRYHNTIWLVFSAYHRIPTELLGSSMPKGVKKIEQLPSEERTILLIHTDGSFYPDTTRGDRDYHWRVTLLKNERYPDNLIPLQYRTNTRSPDILFPILQYSAPARLIDPASQNELLVAPMYIKDHGNYPERRWPQATALSSNQGIAIVTHADGTRLRAIRNGLTLTTRGGISLSEGLPEITIERYDVLKSTKEALFPYDKWKIDEKQNVYTTLAQLQNQLVTSEDQDTYIIKVRMAQHMMAEGLYHEALSLLNQLEEEAPDFFKEYNLGLIRAGAHFMAGRFQEAAIDFANPDVPEGPEIQYWKRIVNLAQTGRNVPITFNTFERVFAKLYPPEMRRRLFLMAADHYINREEFNQALGALDGMNKADLIGTSIGEVDYLLGKIAASKGQLEAAKEIWENILYETDDRYVRSRSQFGLTTMLFENGAITVQQAIDRLEPVRVMWRNDQFEINLLTFMAKLYVRNEEYAQALRTWREIVVNYPEDPVALESAQNMARLYQNLFLKNGADKLKPLEALSVFYEFRDLSPIGRKGDMMVQNLADILTRVDLLDRAAALLSHQIRFRLEGKDRSMVGARLALIHLLNRKPREALAVLKVTGFGGNSETLQRQRDHLTAKALMDTGEYDRAIRILAPDKSQEGIGLTLQAYWEQKDWLNVIDSAEELLSTRESLNEPLTPEEGAYLIKLAVAYLFEDDMTQLGYLRQYFLPLMKENPNLKTFLYLTDDTRPISPSNIGEVLKSVRNVQGFLDAYRKDIAEKGLSKTIQN